MIRRPPSSTLTDTRFPYTTLFRSDCLVDRHLLGLNAVREGGVGAVLQQAPHQVGQQILMAADRRIDAARQVHLVRPDDLLVERLAHAVQALEDRKSTRLNSSH